jgi:phthiocerol/phenolphthiocerol synthesis type-I polyketide synthase B
MFSSISGLLGSRWLGHYAATTTFLDTFAYARRAAGLPATTVNWGVWKSLCDNQSDEQTRVTLESGLEPMRDEVAIRALRAVTGVGTPTRSVVVAADWPRLAAAYRTRAALRIIEDLVPSDGTDSSTVDVAPGDDFRAALHNCDPTRRRALLLDHVTSLVAAVMGLESPQSLDPSAGFFHFGMDSLMSVTLQRALSDTLGVTVPASVVFDYPTIEALTDHLADCLLDFEGQAVDSNDDAELSEADLLQQLSERLSEAR